MANDNLISIAITPQQAQDALQAINQLKTLLPQELVNLTPDERHFYAKMGDKTVAFVQKSLDYAQLNPALVPPYIDVAEMKKDVEAVQALGTLYKALGEVYTKLDDSMLLAGSEAFTASLSFYNSAKDAAKHNVSGAQAIVDDLKTRFPGRKTKKNTPPVQP
ncbi:MAG: hypothetical protein HY840_11765 [Bacteroidetes bacterium]|nr:hypothetical protein [Bacteroidota bacterium]